MSSYEPVPVEVTYTHWTSRGRPHMHVADVVCITQTFLHATLLLFLLLSHRNLKGFLHQQPQSSLACLVHQVS